MNTHSRDMWKLYVGIGLMLSLYGAGVMGSLTAGGQTGLDSLSVIPGDNVSLLLPTDEEWSTCYFFKIRSGSGNDERCDLMFDSEKKATVIKKCKPKEFQEMVTTDPDHPQDCAILIPNFNHNQSGRWEARFGPDRTNEGIQLLLAEEAQNATVAVLDEVTVENEVVNVRCEVMGGSPAPKLYFGFNITEESFNVSSPNDSEEYSNKSYISGENGSTAAQAQLKLTAKLNGLKPKCHVLQTGENEQLYFHSDVISEAKLNVMFAPRLSTNETEKTIEVMLGHNVNLTLEVESNPKPTVVSWKIVNNNCLSKGNKSEGDCESTLTKENNSTSRFSFVKITELVESELSNNMYLNMLTVKNVSQEDANLTIIGYVENTIGSLNMTYKLALVEQTTTAKPTAKPTTNQPDKPDPSQNVDQEPQKGGNVTGITVFGILVILSILAVIGVTIYQKRMKNNEEERPLTDS